MRCKVCGAEMDWEDCGLCDEGFLDGYDEDPLWYDPGDMVRCSQCAGTGGWWVCCNLDNHTKSHAAEQRNAGDGANGQSQADTQARA